MLARTSMGSNHAQKHTPIQVLSRTLPTKDINHKPTNILWDLPLQQDLANLTTSQKIEQTTFSKHIAVLIPPIDLHSWILRISMNVDNIIEIKTSCDYPSNV